MSINYSNSFVNRISRIFSAKKNKYNSSYNSSKSEPISNLTTEGKPFSQASPEIQRIIERVLQAEKDKLYMSNPRYINDDILTIIKEEIKDL